MQWLFNFFLNKPLLSFFFLHQRLSCVNITIPFQLKCSRIILKSLQTRELRTIWSIARSPLNHYQILQLFF